MEKIAAVIGVLCISVFVMGLLYQLGLFEKTEKVIKFVTAMCLIITILKSVKEFKPDFVYRNLNNMEIANVYYKEFNDEIIFKTKQELENIIKKRLDEKNLSYNHISVHILEQNDTVSIDEIVVNGINADKEELYDLFEDMMDNNTTIKTGD